MCIPIAPITQDCKSIQGGLVDAIYIARKDEIESIPAATSETGPIAGDITMKAGKAFVAFSFVEDTASMKEESVGDKGFRATKTTVSCMIKGNKGQVNRMLNQMLNGSYVLIVKDAQDPDNKQLWVIGDTDKGVGMNVKKDWGTKGEDKSSVTLEFEITSSKGALLFTGPAGIPLTPAV